MYENCVECGADFDPDTSEGDVFGLCNDCLKRENKALESDLKEMEDRQQEYWSWVKDYYSN